MADKTFGRSVVRAVDAHAVHALLEKIADQGVVVSGFAGHGHHDRDAARRRGSQHRFGVSLQQPLAGRKIDGFQRAGHDFLLRIAESLENVEHRLNRRQHVRLRATERGQAGGGQLRLETTQIMASKRQIVQEVARAQLMMWMDVLQQIRRIVDEPQQVMSNFLELADQAQECAVWWRVSHGCTSRDTGTGADPRSIS